MPSTATTSVYGNTAYTTITPGATVGAFSIPGRAGGPVSRTWKVQADCVDFTADWEGDDQGWRKLRSTSLKEDSSKEAVGILEEFCPRMAELLMQQSLLVSQKTDGILFRAIAALLKASSTTSSPHQRL